jgi:putative dimethyl sulfoxide reductase chaperone
MNQNNNGTKLRETLLGESLLFGLLGRATYNPPEKSWLDSLIQKDIFTEVPFGAAQSETQRGQEILHDWVQKNTGGLGEELIKDLKADYTHLFVGIGKVLAPPWESVYFNEDRMIFQEQTLDVRNWYHRFGLELENIHKEPDDHIGLEMSFIAYLAELGGKLLEEKDDEKFVLLNDAKRQFLSDHLLLWGPAWCALIIEHAKTDYYRGLGHLTLGALLAMADLYDIQIPDKVTK